MPGLGLAARRYSSAPAPFRCVLLEVDQFKQLDLVPLRGEDQLVLLAVEAHFEGYVIKGQVQNILHLGHQFIPPLMVLVLIHPLTQLCLLLSKFLHAPPSAPGSTPRTGAERLPFDTIQ